MKRICALFAMTLIALLPAKAKAATVVSERDAVAATLVLEAGGTGERGMAAVAHVIWNRSRVSGLSPYRVVTQRGQFAVMRNGPAAAIAKARRHPEWRTALSLYGLFHNSHSSLYDFTGGATHFESFKGRKPWWAKSMVLTVRIGGNAFYRPKPKHR
jgi:spore germination cell wall hydrolase CwlJ-like protein